MKLFVVACAVLVCSAFTQRVSAQTYTPGELRATAIVANAQVTADAQRRRLDAPTLTPRPTLIPSETSMPTSTEMLQPTATETLIPPTATQTSIAPMIVPTTIVAQAEAPKSGANLIQAAIIFVLGTTTIGGLFGLYLLIVGRTKIK